MQNIVIISEEEKEILLKNITIIKGISSQLRSYLEKNMGEEDMGISKIKPVDFLHKINSLNSSVDEILDIIK